MVPPSSQLGTNEDKEADNHKGSAKCLAVFRSFAENNEPEKDKPPADDEPYLDVLPRFLDCDWPVRFLIPLLFVDPSAFLWCQIHMRLLR